MVYNEENLYLTVIRLTKKYVDLVALPHNVYNIFSLLLHLKGSALQSVFQSTVHNPGSVPYMVDTVISHSS